MTDKAQPMLCSDEDLNAFWDGIESLAGYDPVEGHAELIRLASEGVLNRVSVMWDGKVDPERIANPAQLRVACAHRALAIGIARTHKVGEDTMYKRLRDYHAAEYERALASLVLAVRPGEAKKRRGN